MNLLTVTQAAAHLGVSARRVRVFCAQGRIKATRLTSGWVILADDLNDYQPGPVGYPKGRKRTYSHK